MFSRFFIDRPIFSSVISLMIIVAGIVTYTKLPVAQFPDIVPPVVTVEATYPGANPKTVNETVAIPIEQQVNGVDNMIYMTSTSSSDGSYTLTISFEVGTDPDIATVLVQNRVSLATPLLPEDVRRLGVNVKKRSTNMLGLYSVHEKPRYDANGKQLPLEKSELYLSNFTTIFVRDQLARVHGVGDAMLIDAKDYSMRVWLDPNILAERNLSVQEIISVIQEQNVQVVSGRVGDEPVPEGQVLNLTLNSQGRLADVEQFENLVVRSDDEGRILKLKDIGRIELGKYSYAKMSLFNNAPSSSLILYQLPGANAVAVIEAVRAKIEELKPILENSGLEISTAYDSTLFITASIDEVLETLYVAVLIVIAIVYLFLQDWRAALIPTLVIPVSLIGCFFLMFLFGFSLNTLSMFGLILVIGIVVDDAIVVVENTQRILNSHPELSPKDAAKKSMEEVSGPIISTTCVLCSVFIPTTFIGGMVGILYTQFALTIAGAVMISALCAMTISPALCAIFLRPEKEGKKFIGFRIFNFFFDGFHSGYSMCLNKIVRVPLFLLLCWVALTIALGWGMDVMPKGFLPNEDQGVLFIDTRLPDGASLERTQKVAHKISEIASRLPGGESALTIAGYSMLDGSSAPNVLFGIIRLKDWGERSKAEYSDILAGQLMAEINATIPEAQTLVFQPPAIMGIGTSGGLECQLLDMRGKGELAIYDSLQKISQMAVESGKFTSAISTFRPTVPQYYLDIDREKAKKMGIQLGELFSTLQTYIGTSYVNDFNRFERVFRVVLQSDGKNRQNIEQILNLPLMNGEGKKLPLRSIASIKQIVGPQYLNRFNMSPSSMIIANLSPGQSTGVGIQALEEFEKNLPDGFRVDWSGMSYQEKTTGSSVAIVFVLAVIFGFLTLAAQYESWSAPLIIMMAIPLGVSGAILAVALRGLDVNIYTQIGLILMVGLSAKNAILITEVARDNHLKDKMETVASAVKAGNQRLRPIMMTSFAFILGVIPLAIASGAGANSRKAIGTAVCGGMLEETMVGILVTPVLFIILTRVSESVMKVFRKMLGSETAKDPE